MMEEDGCDAIALPLRESGATDIAVSKLGAISLAVRVAEPRSHRLVRASVSKI